MDGAFILPIILEGEELELSAKLVSTGYVHHFEVTVGTKIFRFEKDDESNYRVIGKQFDDKLADNNLFEAIIHSLKMIAG